MKPLKAKESIKEIAKEKGVDPIVVDDIISFYWKKVRESLTTLKHSRVKIDGLGSFNIKENAMLKEEERLNKMLTAIDTEEMTFTKHTKISQMSAKLDYIDGMKEFISEEKDRFKEVETKRIIYDQSKGDNQEEKKHN